MILNFIWIEFIHITMNNNTLQIIVLTPHSLCATTYQLAIFLLCLLVCPIYFLLPLIENNYCGFYTNLICIKFVIIDSYFQLERVLLFLKKSGAEPPGQLHLSFHNSVNRNCLAMCTGSPF
jgi:hypothetical protein